MTARGIVNWVAWVLTLAAVLNWVLVHWLPAVFFFELAVSLLAIDRTVGMRALVTTDIRASRPEGPWPPSKTFWVQLLAGVAGGLAIGYGVVQMPEQVAKTVVIVPLPLVTLWAISLTASRQRRAS